MSLRGCCWKTDKLGCNSLLSNWAIFYKSPKHANASVFNRDTDSWPPDYTGEWEDTPRTRTTW